jgi:WG containing repeat
VKLTGQFAFVDTSGKEVIAMQSGDAGSFSNGLAWIRKGDKFGFIDATGKVVIPVQYDWAESFSEGVAVVTKGRDDQNGRGTSVSFYVDKNGNKAIPREFARASSFKNGSAYVFTSRDADGYVNATATIDLKGNYLGPVKPFVRSLSCEEKARLIPFRAGDVVEYAGSPVLYVITAYHCYNDSYEARTNGYYKGNHQGREGSFAVQYFNNSVFRKVNATTCPVCNGNGQWVENKTHTKTDVDNYNANVPGGKVITTTTNNFQETVICHQCKGVGVLKQ